MRIQARMQHTSPHGALHILHPSTATLIPAALLQTRNRPYPLSLQGTPSCPTVSCLR